ncbi:heparinase II/III domain-containing protein [Pontiella sulfatireligans]|uniref:Heparin and heparin-sulfate lyase n=1 Tax=Pontiella sulfatireligans TaxID=2750658 RepID=A0A6C2UFX0_9BACT|nr:heparinase II/III family protein [Pontiella sulfatireligans]VGO19112.1 Heparin and heparin-sulfate lyase [Pontiella sulfatireligans]
MKNGIIALLTSVWVVGSAVAVPSAPRLLEKYPTEADFLAAYADEDLEARITKETPRLFLTKSRVDEFKKDPEKCALIASYKEHIEAQMEEYNYPAISPVEYWAQFKEILSEDSRLVSRGRSRFDPTDDALKAAWVYLWTGDQRFSEYAEWLLSVSLLTYELRAELYYTIDWYGWSRLKWVMTYDWIYNDMPESSRSDLLPRYVNAMAPYVTGKKKMGSYNEAGNGKEMGAYGPGFLKFYIPIVALDKPFIPEEMKANLLRPWLQKGYHELLELLYYRTQSRGEFGGCSSTTLTYSIGAYPKTIFNFLYVSRSALNLDFAAISPDLLGLPYYLIWNMILGENEVLYQYGSGDLQKRESKFPGQNLDHYMEAFISLYPNADPNSTDLMRFIRDKFPAEEDHLYYSLLRESQDETRAEFDESILPKAFYFPVMGQTFSRNAFATNGTYAMFQCGGKMIAHRHADNLHFTLYKNGFQALDSGNRPRYSDGDHSKYYYQQSVAHNVVLIHGDGDKKRGNRNDSFYGGQIFNQRLNSEVKSFLSNEDFAYIAGDATGSYSSNHVNEVTRQFFHIYPDLFLVFDRIESKKAAFRKDWLLHFADEPLVLPDNSFVSANGSGRLLGKTLLPKNVKTKIVNGFKWDEDTEFPIHYWDKFSAAEQANQGKWRVEVTPGKAQEKDVFLHLLQVGDASLAKIVPHKVVEKEGTAAVRISYNDKLYTILLNKTGELGGSIEILDVESNTTSKVKLKNIVQDQVPFLD